MQNIRFILFVTAIILTNSLSIRAVNASDIIKNPDSVVIKQINIAKKKVMGHLQTGKLNRAFTLNGARVKSPEFYENSEKHTKIWFTTQEGKQLKWPFIELHHSNPANIEPAAGTAIPRYTVPPKTYNHYSGHTHTEFKNGLPSSFQGNDEMPYYAALKTAATKRPKPRKASFIK